MVNKKRHTHKKKKHDEWRARGNREHLKNYRNVQTLFFSSLLSFTARMTKPTPSWLIYFSSATANNRKKKGKRNISLPVATGKLQSRSNGKRKAKKKKDNMLAARSKKKKGIEKKKR